MASLLSILSLSLLVLPYLVQSNTAIPLQQRTATSWPGSQNCTVMWFQQRIDHFGYHEDGNGDPPRPNNEGGANNRTHFFQKYLINDSFYNGRGPIIAYIGNEGPVEQFADHIGQVWMLAQQLQGVAVFIEHRYFGASIPQCVTPPSPTSSYNATSSFSSASLSQDSSSLLTQTSCLTYLDVEQALVDFSTILELLRTETYPTTAGIVAIGGSYGGLLAGWMRSRFPLVVDAAIASSAPFLLLKTTGGVDSSLYWQAVTQDTAFVGGKASRVHPGTSSFSGNETCAESFNLAFKEIQSLITSSAGGSQVQTRMKLCSNPYQSNDPESSFNQLGSIIQGTLNLLAMGDYPFASSFFGGNPQHPLPPRPMQVACKLMMGPLGVAHSRNSNSRLESLGQAIGVLLNATGTLSCFNISKNPYDLSPTWEVLVCRDRLAHSMPFYPARGWPYDMFWPQVNYTPSMITAYCQKNFGATPRFHWLNLMLPTPSAAVGASRIIFVNGKLDPFHVGGVLKNSSAMNSDLIAYFMEGAAHHEDLFFPSINDSVVVNNTRNAERDLIRSWLQL